jgi:hypothetical protein
MLASLLPYVSISLYTHDKKVYLADSSAKLYRPWAYYSSKVRTNCTAAARLSANFLARQQKSSMQLQVCIGRCIGHADCAMQHLLS